MDEDLSSSCGNCRFARNRHATPAMAAAAEAAGHTIPQLQCRRYPTLFAKRPDEWCGEHQLAEAS